MEERERKLNADGQILFLLLWNYRYPSSSTVAAQNNCLSTAPAAGNVSLHGFTSFSFPFPGGISICGAKPTQVYYIKVQRHNPAEIKVFIPCSLPLICGFCSFLHDVFVLRDKNWKVGENSQPFHWSNFHWPQLPRIRKGSTPRKYASHMRLSEFCWLEYNMRLRYQLRLYQENILS